MLKKIAVVVFMSCLAIGAILFWNLPCEAQWIKTYGGSEPDYHSAAQQTADGGYIVAGSTYSFGAGNEDLWLLKLDSTGSVTWQKTYGSTGDEYSSFVQQTEDGGYIVAGGTRSFGAGNDDAWIMKLDASGNVTWQKTYGTAESDYATFVQQTADGGYIVAGSTNSSGGGNYDAWLLKLDGSGNVTWQKTYGGSFNDWANSIRQTADEGYIVAGGTSSFGEGNQDFWLLKLDASGNVTWQKAYGSTDSDDTSYVRQTADGGYIVTGWTYSFGAGNRDIWVLKLDSSGEATWQKTYGGSLSDYAYSVQQTSEGGYVVAGGSYSFGKGQNDAWLLKLDASGNIIWQKTYGGTAYDTAYAVQQTSDGGYVMAGNNTSFGAGSADLWVLKLDENGSTGTCHFEGISTAVVSDTAATATVTTATIGATSVTGADTTIVPIASNATSIEICPPVLSVLFPNGGEELTPDTAWDISWTPFVLASSFKVSYSLDNGSTWALIGKGITETSTTWTTPLLTKNKTKCLIKVAGFDDKGKKVGVDKSDEPFAIGVLTITDINGANNCTSGLTCPITWTLADTITPDQLQVSYTLDGGATWKKEPPIPMPPGSTYDWTAPNVNKDKTCKLKLTLKTAEIKVATATSGKFTINKP